MRITLTSQRGGQSFLEALEVYSDYFFVVSLVVTSLPTVVDVIVPCVLIWRFTCVRCYSFKEHLNRYSFKSFLKNISLVFIV
ncbi:hypothetical protein MtrunA17_Chr2g0332301 [Medicago truncatula]|uniref:Transmembrane protein, putative n=1 Tax=Medicago truncatula TaxID=3880 RepID=G7IMG3_MEDTR|nr:transmembrane protein, putative [Medicago truncatula]RHN76455.1 hypothetical protein MtrunA17_Chr2g0332301 [Medicago truncatula]